MKRYILFIISLVLFTGCSISGSESESKKDQEKESITAINQDNLPESSFATVSVTATRLGSSGTGKDIVARDDVYILGENSKIYKFNGSSWVLEPGGGTGKRISATDDYLLLCGSNNNIYYKQMGSSSGWTHWTGTGNSECRDIAGNRSVTGVSGYRPASVIGMNKYIYQWVNNDWSIVYNGGGSNYADWNPLDIATDEYGGNIFRADVLDDPLFGGWYDDLLVEGSTADYQTSVNDVSFGSSQSQWGPGSSFYYTSSQGDIVDTSDGTIYQISGRHAERLAIGNDGTIYFIDKNDKIYKVNI